jgi:hypothetical protein
LFAAVVWPVMQWGVWYSIDEPAAEGFKEWIFAGAHLIFGVVVAGFASIAVAGDEPVMRERGRHAAGRTPAQPAPAPGSLFRPDQAVRPAPSRTQIEQGLSPGDPLGASRQVRRSAVRWTGPPR